MMPAAPLVGAVTILPPDESDEIDPVFGEFARAVRILGFEAQEPVSCSTPHAERTRKVAVARDTTNLALDHHIADVQQAVPDLVERAAFEFHLGHDLTDAAAPSFAELQ